MDFSRNDELSGIKVPASDGADRPGLGADALGNEALTATQTDGYRQAFTNGHEEGRCDRYLPPSIPPKLDLTAILIGAFALTSESLA